MGLALFFGNQAQAHSEVTRDWKRLWQTDEQLRLEDEKVRQQQEQFEATQRLEERKLAQSREQFDWQRELQQMQHDATIRELDLQQAENFYDSFLVQYEDADFIEKKAMLQSAGSSTLAGMGDFGDRLSILEAGLNDRRYSTDEAWAIIYQALSPIRLDAQGNPLTFSEAEVDEAFRVARAASSGENMAPYEEAFAEWERKKEAYLEGAEFVASENIQARAINNALLTAQAAEAEAGAKLKAAQAMTEDETRQYVVDNFKLRNRLADLEAQGAEITLATMEDAIALEMREMEVRIAGHEQEQAIREEQRSVILDTLVAELGMTQAEAEVAARTIEARVRAAELTPEQLEAEIASIKASTSLTEAQTNEVYTNTFATLVAAGRDELVANYSEDLLRPIFGDDWEEVRDRAVEAASKVRTDQEATTEANNALTYAKAERDYAAARYDDARTEVIPEQMQQEWAKIDIQRMEAKARILAARMANRPAPPKPFNDTLKDWGITRDGLREREETLDDLITVVGAVRGMLGGDGKPGTPDRERRQYLESMGGFFEAHGLAGLDLSAPSDETLKMIDQTLTRRMENLQGQLAQDYSMIMDLGASYGMDAPNAVRQAGGSVTPGTVGRDAFDLANRAYSPAAITGAEAETAVDMAINTFLSGVSGELGFTPGMEENLYEFVAQMLPGVFPDDDPYELMEALDITPMALRYKAEALGQEQFSLASDINFGAQMIGISVDTTDADSLRQVAFDLRPVETALTDFSSVDAELFARRYNSAMMRGDTDEASQVIMELNEAAGFAGWEAAQYQIWEIDMRSGEVTGNLDPDKIMDNMVNPRLARIQELRSDIAELTGKFVK